MKLVGWGVQHLGVQGLFRAFAAAKNKRLATFAGHIKHLTLDMHCSYSHANFRYIVEIDNQKNLSVVASLPKHNTFGTHRLAVRWDTEPSEWSKRCLHA